MVSVTKDKILHYRPPQVMNFPPICQYVYYEVNQLFKNKYINSHNDY